ncbi:hypothetical protein LCGC14_1290590 [marine sediment metagenome]|uniref:Uncharacterized protein n=1 Tax=marine sediment metagenome TaxID=412755 RepID=A0A0F9KUA0_9ZZZZ
MKWREIRKDPPKEDYIFCLACNCMSPDEESLQLSYCFDVKEFYTYLDEEQVTIEDLTHWMEMPTYADCQN